MKNLVKSLKVFLLSIVTIGMLASCSDDTSETTPIEPQEPKMINLGFDGYTLTPEPEAKRKIGGLMEDEWGVSHTYMTTGYTVKITGGVSPDYSSFTGVDLADPDGIPIEVVGDVTVTVSHPLLVGVEVTEAAYYGADNIDVPYDSESYVISTELVQGFVIVTEGEDVGDVINGVVVNDIEGKTKDIPYYTADESVWVDVETRGYDLSGTATNMIGKGVRFTVNSSGELIMFELPEFGAPEDGILLPQ